MLNKHVRVLVLMLYNVHCFRKLQPITIDKNRCRLFKGKGQSFQNRPKRNVIPKHISSEMKKVCKKCVNSLGLTIIKYDLAFSTHQAMSTIT